jgi:RNA polymerase sigma factor (TIGR02999 family)
VPNEVRVEVTTLLEQVAAGDEGAKNELFALVYDELRTRARDRMKRERPDHTWGATGLVHEVYFQLMKGRCVFTRNRAYFFGAAARAMEQLLRAYARGRESRPGAYMDPDGAALLQEVAASVESTLRVRLLDLTDALDDLEAIGKQGPRRAEVVRLRIWGALTYQEVATNLDVSVATVEKDWLAARAWLYGRLKGRRTNG